MSSPNVSLPIEIIINICDILLSQEQFLELESMLYIFPQLKRYFDYEFPTIVVVDTNQYDKYIKFIHTRERPFGSKDLLIIKMERDLKNRKDKAKAPNPKCYLVVGSKRNQDLIPKGFEFLSHYVTLVENKTLIDLYHDDSCRCYDLACEPKEKDERVFRSAGYTYTKDGIFTSFHVALFMKCFLRAIEPSMLRFENYSGSYDISSNYDEMRSLYESMIDISLPDERFDFHNMHEDDYFDDPKCSFEFIKETDRFDSLYQFSETYEFFDDNDHIETLSSYLKEMKNSKTYSCLWDRFLCRKQIFKFGLFLDIKDVVIEKVSDQVQKNRKNDFMLIDCSKSAIGFESSHEFIRNYALYVNSPVPRINKPEPQPEGDETEIAEYNEITRLGGKGEKSLPHYIKVHFLDFFQEKLQSVDITAFHSSSNIRFNKNLYSDTNAGQRVSTQPVKQKDLEISINSLVEFISSLVNTEGVHHEWGKIAELCKKVMITTVHSVLKFEGLSKHQPFRIRLFSKYSNWIMVENQKSYLQRWFDRHMC